MTRLSIVLFACAVRLVGQAQGPAPATDSAMLNGQVVARTDGRALAGVHLELLGEPGRPGPTTSSDSFGRFTLSGVSATSTAVFIFSTESRHWYPFSPFLARTVTQADGAFSIRGVPAGTYYVAAAPASASSPAVPIGRGEAEWQQPDVLDALRAGALVVSLQEGQRSTVQLRR
ncbi:MAG: hypothetical protein ABL986_17900 [Vicinamibacterales bacterium]